MYLFRLFCILPQLTKRAILVCNAIGSPQFNTFVLKLQQEEYEQEGIAWQYVPFTDNDACVALIQGGGGGGAHQGGGGGGGAWIDRVGILGLLDEECKVPGGSDLNLAHKILQQRHAHLEAPKACPDAFAIRHYAARVTYHVSVFLCFCV